MAILASKERSLDSRVLTVLGRITPVCAEAAKAVVDGGIVDMLLNRLKVRFLHYITVV